MSQAPPFYVTTPIYYVNARPHLGHAYTTILADVARRFHEMKGIDTYFLTGTDEHGDKIVRAAEKEGKTPREYADHISGLFREMWPELNIRYDQFIRTTDPAHQAVVRRLLQQIHDAGDIYFSEYEGLYCFGCERFYTERELSDGKCPDHETEPEPIRESNYFFKMGKYQEWLIEHIQENPTFIRPERYRNEVLAFLRDPLEDLCISRPKSRLQWGIPLPFDDNYVTYVWFDALINYISALDFPDGERFRRYWPGAQHIVAKDILKPHGIYWPTMLRAANIPVYRHLNVHGYWNVEHSKMSKSLGNVAEPLELKNIYGLEPFRFFLIREMVFGLDANFSEAALIQRINADLANDLGNLFSRVLTMAHKYVRGAVPEDPPDAQREPGFGLQENAERAVAEYESAMEDFAFHKGLAAVWEFIGQMNKYVDVTAPWELAKQKPCRKQLKKVLYELLEGLRIVSGLIQPVMPQAAATMQKHLGLRTDTETDAPFFTLEDLRRWGGLSPGTPLPKSITLFPRIDTRERDRPSASPAGETADVAPIKPEISIDALTQVDLRVATVLEAAPLPKARKLLKLTVDMGEKRTIVAGVAAQYAPEALVGKQVVVVANLKPAKLMGVLSEGMALAAADDGGPSLITVDRPVKPGTPLS